MIHREDVKGAFRDGPDTDPDRIDKQDEAIAN